MADCVPYYDLSYQTKACKKEIKAAFDRLLEQGNFILGPDVDSFEKAFAKYCHVEHAIAVNSGTSALHLAMKLMGIGSGDEVITTPYTFAATSWAISYVGAKPVYVDIDECTFNIDATKLESALTERTRALIVVHLYGHPCDMDPIMKICDKNKLLLVEDAAQAHGARYKGQPVGTFGNIGIFSFYPTKNLGTCGEGGALVTDEDKVAERARLLRNLGLKARYVHEEVGYNYRMEAIHGAILGIKLKYLDEWNEERLHAAVQYNELLEDETQIQLPFEAPWAESAYHLYTILCPKRDQLCKYLKKNGVGYSTHYPIPLHLQQCYKGLGYERGSFPIAERVAREAVNLPLFPGITRQQIKQVARTIKQFLKENS